MLGFIMCEGLSCLSAPSDHDSTLCPGVGVWESSSTYHRRRFISAQPPTSSAPPSAHSQWPSHCSIPPSLLFPSLLLQSNSVWLYFSTQHVDSSDYIYIYIYINTLSTAHPTLSVYPHSVLPRVSRLITILSACPWPSPRTLRTRRPDWWNYLCC